MKNKLSVFTSFKGNVNRFPIYSFNYSKLGGNIPAETEFFVNDSSDNDELCLKNEQIFKKYFKNNINYYQNNLTLLESWIFVLKKIKTPYVMSLFDDQFLFNLKISTIQNAVEFIETENIDVYLFVCFETVSVDDEKKILKITNSESEKIKKHMIKRKNINGQDFAIINNDFAQFKYGFFLNNAIYKTDLILKQIEFFASKFSGAKSGHIAEMNHAICPENIRNNKVGICLSDEVAHLDLDYSHIVGIRPTSKWAMQNFLSVSMGYKIEII